MTNSKISQVSCSNSNLSFINSEENRLNTAREFVKLVTGDAETACTWGCYGDKKTLKLPAKQYYGSISKQFKTLDKLNQEGYGVFLTIQETSSKNRTTEDIGRTRALYIESDSVGLPGSFHIQPSVIVESSPGKHHIYWMLKELVSLSADEFKEYIKPLIRHYQTDVSCCDLSRVLRVPGFFHKKSEPFLVRMIVKTDVKYSLDDIQITEYIERLHAECEKSLQIVEYAVKGERRNTLLKKTYYLGGLLAEYPKLSEEYRVKLHALVDSLEASGDWEENPASHDTIDSGFEKGSLKPISLDDQTEVESVDDEDLKDSSSNTSQKAPKKDKLSGESIVSLCDRLLNECVSDSLAKAELGFNYTVYVQRKKEREAVEDSEAAALGLPTLLEAQNARLSAKTVLYGDNGALADVMTTMAERMGVPVEFLTTTFLAVAGSRVGTSSTLMIDPSTDRIASSIFWTCVVAETGQKKTPAQNLIIKPLAELENTSFGEHKEAITQHKLDLQQYKFDLKNSGGDTNMQTKDGFKERNPEPEPPKRKRYIIVNSTNETKLRIHSENPRGLLHHRDEWIGFMDAQNKYRGGKGDDSSNDLSEFNGSYTSKDVMDDERAIFIEKTSISKTGNTQPEVLKKFQSKEGFDDFSGALSRWLFCLVPAKTAYANLFSEDDGSNLILRSTLKDIYIQLGALPDFQYKLSDDAKRVYQPIERTLLDSLGEETHPGLKATYPKLITYVERFALLLHVVNNVLEGKTPGEFVSGFTMKQACKMAEFYLAQARILYALNGDDKSIPGEFLKVKDAIAKYPDGISIRDLRQKSRAMKALPVEQVKQACEALSKANVLAEADGKYFMVG